MNNKNITTIFVASDHAGYELKEQILKFLEKQNYFVNDLGCYSVESVDYPDYAVNVANNVKENIYFSKGILICGTGSGMVIAANKIKGIRAVNCFTKEMADMAIKHNNANILCLGARIIKSKDTLNIVRAFLESEFEGERHQVRIDKIHNLTEK